MERRHYRLRGFTLIELLVVVAVVSLLVALLLPALSQARERAHQARCASNLRQFVQFLLIYDQENGEFPRGRYNVPNAMMDKVHQDFRDEYGFGVDMAYCPSGTRIPYHAYKWETNHTAGGMGYYYFAGTSTHPDNNKPATSYGNGWTSGSFPRRSAGFYPAVSASRPYPLPWKQLQPSQQFMMMDISYWNLTSTPHAYLPRTPNHVGIPGSSIGANTSFMDGHVEWAALIPGVSWKFFGSSTSLDRGFWTPRHIPTPTGAQLLQ